MPVDTRSADNSYVEVFWQGGPSGQKSNPYKKSISYDKKDIVSIWGNTVPEFGMAPYLSTPNSRVVEVYDLRCRPCSKLGYGKCPKKHFNCMNMINEIEIASCVN